MSWAEQNGWFMYGLTCLLVSIVALIIHVRTYSPPNWEEFLLWLPITWFLVLVFAMGFHYFLK